MKEKLNRSNDIYRLIEEYRLITAKYLPTGLGASLVGSSLFEKQLFMENLSVKSRPYCR